MKLPDNYVAGKLQPKPTAMGGFGQGMLERLGWRKGEGLGKQRQGRADPLDVKKKDDTAGLGGKFDWNWSEDYAANAFDGAVTAIRVDASDASASSSESSDDEEPRLARNTDGTVSSSSAAELKCAWELAKGNHLGRFGGRAGKLARVREQESLLGGQSEYKAAAPSLKTPSEVRVTQVPLRNPPAVVIIGPDKGHPQPAAPPLLLPESWWGHKFFTSAGWLEGLGSVSSKSNQKDARARFDEETQERLYNSVHAAQSNVCCRPIFSQKLFTRNVRDFEESQNS
jgi:hypothetical protein